MLPEMPDDMQEAQELGISLFAGEAEDRLDIVLRDAVAGTLKPLYNLHGRPAGHGGRAAPIPARRPHRTHRRPAVQLRRGARLPVPVFVLHHHQRAGTQVTLPLGGRCRGDRSPQPGAGRQPFLHHRRQSRAQQELGADLRPADRAARKRGHATSRLRHSGRHALPQIPRFIEKAARAGRAPRLHRAGEHQPGKFARGEEEAEPHRRIPQHAARLEERSAASPMPAISWASRTTRPKRSCATSRSSSANCRSTCWSSSALRRCRVRKTIKKLLRLGRADGSGHEQIRSGARRAPRIPRCPRRNGSAPTTGVAEPTTRRAHGNDHAPRDGDTDQSRQDDVLAASGSMAA